MKLSYFNVTAHANAGATLTVRDFRVVATVDGPVPPLLGADGEPATITLLGLDSNVGKNHQNQSAADAQNRVFATMGKKTASVSAEDVAEQHERDIALLVSLTTDWRGFEDEAGDAIPFSPEAVRELYHDCPPIRDQVFAFVSDRRNYLPKPASVRPAA